MEGSDMRLVNVNLVMVVLLAVCCLAGVGETTAAETDSGDHPSAGLKDERANEEVTLDTPRAFPRITSREEWRKRASEIREHILVSTGLWPMPEKTPLNAKIFGRLERDGYSIEKACFESYPGFFVTGNLYRPLGKKGPFPAILCPHGHWGRGRLHSDDTGSIHGRCVSFARQGCVAFSYDMVGYNDSKQVGHSFKDEVWGASLMGLQLWDSIRAADFLTSLPEVDADRLACTGASGGGTQTFMLMAVDDRIKVAAPVCMISAHFQGGCECENAPLLRLDLYNVEIGSVMAPRPLILISATGDWTKNTPTVEYPDIRSIYALFGAEDKVKSVQFDTGHNYNKDSREAVYAWFGKWLLGITDPERLKEQPFTVEKDEDMLVFTEAHPRPSDALTAEGLKEYLARSARAQVDALSPRDAAGLRRFRRTMSVSLSHTLSAAVPAKEDLQVEEVSSSAHDAFTASRLLIGRKGKHEAIPAVLLTPQRGSSRRMATLIIHPSGKDAVMKMSQPLSPLVAELLNEGSAVMAIDCFGTGELKFGERKRTANHWLTYNRTDLALRVQDILTVVGYLQSQEDVRRVALVGQDAAGVWCLLANAVAPGIRRAAFDTNGFTDDEAAWEGENLIPGILRAGGARVAAALCSPRALLLYNTGGKFPVDMATSAYQAAGRARGLRLEEGSISGDEIARWVLGR
jgi:dienelactone hydrolase